MSDKPITHADLDEWEADARDFRRLTVDIYKTFDKTPPCISREFRLIAEVRRLRELVGDPNA